MKVRTTFTAHTHSRWMHSIKAMLMAILLPVAAMSQSPAPVNLGTAADFVILAKTAISTTGTTAITGDIGVSPAAATAITGFGLIMDASGTFATSSLVTGSVFAADYTTPTPTKMTTAVSDMETAYTDAAGRTSPNFTELHAGDLTGQTLTPGLYKWGTGVLVSAGGVTISGSPTDVWIFQIAQDLTVANTAIVTLSGGAKESNIFWQVAGQVTVGTTVQMKGIILCQTQVALGTGASLVGRVLAQTAVTTDGNAITQPSVGTSVGDDANVKEYALFQNFPNPFNPTTVIEYRLEKSARVSLKIYNMLGLEVVTLVDAHQEAGRYTVPFDAKAGTRSLSTGVYIYRIEAGPFVSMRKLVLMK